MPKATAEIEAEIAEWDALLATDKAQDVLDKLANEVLGASSGANSPDAFYEG